MKKSFLFAAAVALFAACTSDDFSGLAETTPVNPEGYAVGFDAYTGRATTRAGLVGELNLDQIKKSKDEHGGFGVFAYYTDIQKYNKTFMPNFMYNQGVFFNGSSSKWEYSPLMYWPNEYGSKAQSTDEDKVSFFAYAPYVEEVTSTGYAVGDVTTGITGFSRNSATGDPLIRYVATFDPANAVDLCWGVNDEDSWNTIQNGSQETAVKGLPWLDVEHPEGIDQRMKFTFKHALAQLNVQIDAQVDDNVDLADGTKIWVRSISFTGISTQGTLNLNNVEANKALWLDYIGVTELACGEIVTVKDGRRDGREGANGARVGSELPQGLNPVVVQTETPAAGVTKTAVNLFGTDAALSAPVYVIPTGETMSVTIVYDVETVNPKLPGYISDAVTHGVSIENRITKTIDFGTGEGLDNGKKYTLKLHLGMNSVKLDAEVTDWIAVENSTTTDGSKITTYTNEAGEIVSLNAEVTTSEGLSDVLENSDAQNITVEVETDNLEIDFGARNTWGSDQTETIVIDGNGKTVNFRGTDNDWSSIGSKNGTVIIKNAIVNYSIGGNGAWNNHGLNFSSKVLAENVTFTNSVTLAADSEFKNCTFTESGEYYTLWIKANVQNVVVDGCTFTATNNGRGIKIADQYIDEADRTQVNLTVSNSTFTTAKKAAVLVTNTAGAKITASNNVITGVAADTENFVWNDADRTDAWDLVVVSGCTKKQE